MPGGGIALRVSCFNMVIIDNQDLDYPALRAMV